MRTARILAAPLALVACAALAACGGGGKDGPTVTVTVPPTTAQAPGTSPAGNTSATSTATPGTPTPTATALPGNCGAVLSDYYVTQALGGQQLAGATSFVVGVPDATIGRLSTINCRYGVTGTGSTAKAKVEIGVSLYGTDAQATARVTATESDYTSRGATGEDVSIPAADGQPAVIGRYLAGASGSGYELPLLVASVDRRTVAVTVDPAAVTSPPTKDAATAVASVAIKRTAG